MVQVDPVHRLSPRPLASVLDRRPASRGLAPTAAPVPARDTGRTPSAADEIWSRPCPCAHPFVLWLVAAGRVFGGSATDASAYLLDQPLQIGWQGHAVDVGDIGGAQFDPGVAKSPHRAFQPE